MKKLIILNLKTNLDYDSSNDYVLKIKDMIPNDLEIVVCPSSIYLPLFRGDFPFSLGSQDVSIYGITGDITSEMLKSCNVKYCLVAHPERKVYEYENKFTNLKVNNLLNNGIIPIICVGETKEERLRKKTESVLYYEIKKSLEGVKNLNNLIFAYEPSWSIGTGKILNLKEIAEVVSFIKKIMYEEYKIHVKVLYGGSINKSSICDVSKISSLDGILIGKCANNFEELKIIFDNFAR